MTEINFTVTDKTEIAFTVPDDLWRNPHDDPSRPLLNGPTLIVNGLRLHLEAWRVETDDRGVQSAVEADMERDLGDLHNAVHGDGPFTTTVIAGMEYIILATPYCD